MSLAQLKTIMALATLFTVTSCSDARQEMAKLRFEDSGHTEEEFQGADPENPAESSGAKPRDPYSAQVPDNSMRITPGRGETVRFQQAYLHCGAAQTVSNPVAGFFGIGITYNQALARATADCKAPPSAFIAACEASGGAWNPSVNGECLELESVQSSSVPVDLYNAGGGVYSDAISVCRVVYCTPKQSQQLMEQLPQE
jgi:hypothetical protein